jgi:mitochondrial fission protein ELM1
MAVRVVVLGNGVTAAERQCFGLLRALWPAAGISRPDAPCVMPVNSGGLASVTLLRVAWPRGSQPVALLRAMPAAAHVFAGSWYAGVDVPALAAEASAAADAGVLTLLVACGRDTVPGAVAVRAAAPRAVFSVQLLHPRVRLSYFDVCLVPVHDAPRGVAEALLTNAPGAVHYTRGALHDLDAAALAAARAQWAAVLGAAPQPLVVCLVGGPTRACPFDCDAVASRVQALAAATQRAGGSTRCVRAVRSHASGGWQPHRLSPRRATTTHHTLVSCLLPSVCLSRRTPPRLVSALRWATMGMRSVTVLPPCAEASHNPYAGLLAWAHALVVTADSINMVSEALSTARRCARPLTSAPPGLTLPANVPVSTAGCRRLFARFRARPRQSGALRGRRAGKRRRAASNRPGASQRAAAVAHARL